MFSMSFTNNCCKQYNWVKPVSVSFGTDDPKVASLKRIYENNVKIRAEQWETSCYIVNQVLSKIEKHLRKVINFRTSGLTAGEFVPRGSTSEGLKVQYADEFDVIIPVYSQHLTFSYNCDSQKKELADPPGFTKVELHSSQENDVKYCIKTTDAKELFRHAMFECVEEINKGNETNTIVDVTCKAELRQCSAPALELEIYICSSTLRKKLHPVERISVDLVPVFPMKEIHKQKGEKRLFVTALTKSPAAPLSVQKCLQQDVFWKVCFDQIETDIFLTLLQANSSGNKTEDDGIRGGQVCRDSAAVLSMLLLKGIKQKFAESCPRSPFVHFTNSKVLKTCLIHQLLKDNSHEHWKMDNLVSRFTDFINFFLKSVKEANLPQVCFGNPHLAKYYPDEDFYCGKETVNIFNGLAWYDADQIVADLISALKMNQLEFVVENLQLPVVNGKIYRQMNGIHMQKCGFSD